MTLLNFKKDFVTLILGRSKPHTIRQERKHPIKVGDTLQLYYGLRTKSCMWNSHVQSWKGHGRVLT